MAGEGVAQDRLLHEDNDVLSMADRVAAFAAAAGAMVLVHQSFVDPTDRLLRFGFNFSTWREEPYRVVTHLFVHSSSEHLTANLSALWLVLLGFQPQRFPARWNRRVKRVVGLGLLSTIFIASGAAGLFATSLDFSNRSRAAGRAWSWNDSIPWIGQFVSSTQQAVREQATICCGASAGLYGAAVFGLVTRRRWTMAVAVLLGLSFVADRNGVDVPVMSKVWKWFGENVVTSLPARWDEGVNGGQRLASNEGGGRGMSDVGSTVWQTASSLGRAIATYIREAPSVLDVTESLLRSPFVGGSNAAVGGTLQFAVAPPTSTTNGARFVSSSVGDAAHLGGAVFGAVSGVAYWAVALSAV